jgi:hypothetical protein
VRRVAGKFRCAPPPAYAPSVFFERRQAPRLRLSIPVLLDGPHGQRRCLARDLTPAGAFVQTDDPYLDGTVLRVTFSDPGGGAQMTCRCEVRRTLALGDVRGVGLTFRGFELDADDLVSAARRVSA